MLLHSYVLVKLLVKQGDHDTGAVSCALVSGAPALKPCVARGTHVECATRRLPTPSFWHASPRSTDLRQYYARAPQD